MMEKKFAPTRLRGPEIGSGNGESTAIDFKRCDPLHIAGWLSIG